MSETADFRHLVRDGQSSIAFEGDLRLASLGDLPDRLRRDTTTVTTIDLAGVRSLDTIGAWIIHRLSVERDARIVAARDDVRLLLDEVAGADRDTRMRPAKVNSAAQLLAEIGAGTVLAARTLKGLLGFFGAVLIASWNVMRSPRKLRVNAVVQRFEVVGIKALGIIGLMSFLIGIVIAQQGAVQLRQFGAEVFTINLIGRITTRELGVLMTAIMVAGRSGSAFAAQLGTMKLTEEVDAMRTIGVSPIEALVLPRLIATVLMMPLLGFFATVVAIIGGGLFVWTSLGIPPVTFIQRLREVTPLTDMYVGLIKAPVFGLIIGLAGCFQGLLVEKDAEEVGARTTSAVVQAIFLVIVLDAFFAVFFSQIGWI